MVSMGEVLVWRSELARLARSVCESSDEDDDAVAMLLQNMSSGSSDA